MSSVLEGGVRGVKVRLGLGVLDLCTYRYVETYIKTGAIPVAVL